MTAHSRTHAAAAAAQGRAQTAAGRQCSGERSLSLASAERVAGSSAGAATRRLGRPPVATRGLCCGSRACRHARCIRPAADTRARLLFTLLQALRRPTRGLRLRSRSCRLSTLCTRALLPLTLLLAQKRAAVCGQSQAPDCSRPHRRACGVALRRSHCAAEGARRAGKQARAPLPSLSLIHI